MNVELKIVVSHEALAGNAARQWADIKSQIVSDMEERLSEFRALQDSSKETCGQFVRNLIAPISGFPQWGGIRFAPSIYQGEENVFTITVIAPSNDGTFYLSTGGGNKTGGRWPITMSSAKVILAALVGLEGLLPTLYEAELLK